MENRERSFLSAAACLVRGRHRYLQHGGDHERDEPLADSAPTDTEDHILVLRARSGDRAVLEELVRHHQGWIYNIVLRVVLYPQDAEDARQEILLKAATSLSSFEGRSSFRTWLFAFRQPCTEYEAWANSRS